jgi:hypothetical protein
MKTFKISLLLFFMSNMVSFVFGQSLYPNDWCQTATLITDGDIKNGSLGLANIESPNCVHYSSQHGIWFKYEGKGKLLDINFDDAGQFSGMLTVFEGDCDALICLPLAEKRFYAEEGKNYYILFGKQYGTFTDINYSLTFTEKEKVVYDDCYGAIKLNCGQTTTINPSFLTLESIPLSCGDHTTKLGWIEIKGDGKDKILQWNNPATIVKIFERDCDTLKCIRFYNYGQSIKFSTVIGKDYLFGFGVSFNQTIGVVDFSLSCQNNTLPNICTNAVPITCGESLTGKINEFWPPDLLTSDLQGQWYKLTSQGGKHIFQFKFEQFQQIFVQLYKSKGNNCGTDLIEVDYIQYIDPNIGQYVINAAENETVYVKVSSYSTVDFTIKLQCESQIDFNFNCNNSQSLTCGDTLDVYSLKRGEFDSNCTYPEQKGQWFSLEGSDDPYELTYLGEQYANFEYTIFTSDCDTLQCLKSGNLNFNKERKYYFDLPKGNSYNLKIFSNESTYHRARLKLNCPQIVIENVLCESAEEITCFAQKTIDRKTLGISVSEDPCSKLNGKWYKLIGDDKVYKIETQNYFLRASIYQGSCDQLACLTGENTNPPRFKARIGQTYYLKIWNDTELNSEFFLRCVDDIPNHSCASAANLACGEKRTVSLFTNLLPFKQTCQDSVGAWIKISGTGSFVSIECDNNVEIELLTGSCGSLNCINKSYWRMNFFTKKDTVYFIRISSYFENGTNVSMNCLDIPEYNCDHPSPVICGDMIELNTKKMPNLISENPLFVHWLSFTGNGQSMIIQNFYPDIAVQGVQYDVFENDCDNLISTNNTNPWDVKFEKLVINTKPGNIYKIRFSSSQLIDTIRLVTSCIDPVTNQSCEDALPIFCGQSRTYDPTNRTNNLIPIQDPPKQPLYQNAWYQYVATGEIMSIKLNQDQNALYRFEVYEDINGCNSIKEYDTENIFGTQPNIYNYRTIVGKTYYIKFGMNGEFHFENPFYPNFKVNFTLECTSGISPDICAEAVLISCDSSYSTTSLFTTSGTFGDCTLSERGTWYTLNGDGNIYNFVIENNNQQFQNFNVFIGTGTCDNLTCLSQIAIDQGKKYFSVATISDVKYYIKFASNYTNFDLDFRVYCDTLSANFECTKSIGVQCGDIISGNLTGIPIDTNNICNDTRKGLYYHFTGTGEYVGLELVYLNSPIVNIDVYENACTSDGRCLFQSGLNDIRDRKLIINTKKNTKYIIKITEPELFPDISFRIKMICEDEPENLGCSDATLISCGDTSRVSFVTPLGYSDNVPCHWENNIINYWYLLPKTDKLLEMQILSHPEDYNVTLMAGNCSEKYCVKTYTKESKKIVFYQEENSDYYINLFSYFGELGFTLKCVDLAENDKCANAIPVSCGQTISGDLNYATFNGHQTGQICTSSSDNDLWYSIEGNGEVYNLKFSPTNSFSGVVTLYEKGECGKLKCIRSKNVWSSNFPDNEFRFVADDGKEYLVALQGKTEFNFEVICQQTVANDLCSGAFPLNLNSITNVTADNSTPDKIIQCYSGDYNGVWYTFEGNDSIVVIKNANGFFNVNYVLLEGNCENYQCISNGTLYDQSLLKFRPETGRKYLLLIYGHNVLLQTQTFHFADNNSCSDAASIKCSETISINNKNYVYTSGNGDACISANESSAWYKLSGDGRIMVFDFPAQEMSSSMEILNECSGQCIYRHNVSPAEQSTFRLATESNKSYLIKFNISNNTLDKEVKMTTRCEEGQTNVSPFSAYVLACQKYSIDIIKSGINTNHACLPSYYNKYWYKFKGDGSTFKLLSSQLNLVSIEIKDQNCETLHNFNTQTSTFVTETNKEYYLAIYYSTQLLLDKIDFEIQYKCIDNVNDNNIFIKRIKVIPNPFHHSCVVSFHSLSQNDATYEIIDNTGNILFSADLKIKSGDNELKINQEILQHTGLFYLRLKSDFGTNVVKLISIK